MITETDLMYPGYTRRQIDIILGKVEPENSEEEDYFEKHATDLLPQPVKKVSQYGNLTGRDLDNSVKRGGPSTQAAHIAEAEEAREV